MKKLFLVLITIAAIGLVPAVADQNTYFKPGTLVAQAGLGYGWGLGIEGGADLSLAQWVPVEVVPLDLGIGARAGFNTGFLSYGAGLGIAAFGTVHYSWKALKTGIAWVDKLETYTGLGLQFQSNYTYPLWIGSVGGTAYHVDDRLAIELGYYSFLGATIGVTYKLN